MPPRKPDPRVVFVIHGRNLYAFRQMQKFLQQLGLRSYNFDDVKAQMSKGSPYVHDVVDTGMRLARAVLVLLTPDEAVALHPGLEEQAADVEIRWQARPNVLYEAGLAMGVDDRRVILVRLGDVDCPSDLNGHYQVRLTNSHHSRASLRTALQNAGCDIDEHVLTYLDSSHAGDFDVYLDPALPEVSTRSPFCPSEAVPQPRTRDDPASG